jgi:hypothetical protein
MEKKSRPTSAYFNLAAQIIKDGMLEVREREAIVKRQVERDSTG